MNGTFYGVQLSMKTLRVNEDFNLKVTFCLRLNIILFFVNENSIFRGKSKLSGNTCNKLIGYRSVSNNYNSYIPLIKLRNSRARMNSKGIWNNDRKLN